MNSDANEKVELRRIAGDEPRPFELRPDAATCADIAEQLGILVCRKLSFAGQLIPEGKSDWRLQGHLGATVVQPCVVTLEPVTTRIETDVVRQYVAGLKTDFDPDSETEMPEDDSLEPLPEVLNLSEVMTEALALSLPLYPRADNAALDQANFTEPGKSAMTDDDAKPFAALAQLRKQMGNGEKGE